MADIKTVGLSKYFGDTIGVADINLTVGDGELFVITGPTGSGKSTMIRLVAGLEEPTEGDIWIGGRPVSELSAKERRVALLFPNYALPPSVTVFENIAMPLRLQQISAEETSQRVQAAARQVNIHLLLERATAALSVLELYRTALARAFASEPEILLMDGPLANLEPEDRSSALEQLVQCQDELGITVLYTTEDQAEAMKIGDRVAVLCEGRLQQVGTSRELYERPANCFVASFIGRPQMNMIEATVVTRAERVCLDLGLVDLTLPEEIATVLADIAGRPVVMGVRPEDIFDKRAAPPKPTISEDGLEVEVEEVTAVDDRHLLSLNTGQERLKALFSASSAPLAATRIEVVIDLAKIHLFDAETGERLAAPDFSEAGE